MSTLGQACEGPENECSQLAEKNTPSECEKKLQLLLHVTCWLRGSNDMVEKSDEEMDEVKIKLDCLLLPQSCCFWRESNAVHQAIGKWLLLV